MEITEPATPDDHDAPQWRVQFDADVAFANGGGLQAQDFRLDAPGPDLGADDIAALFVRHLGLLMVGSVRISNVQMLREPHKGGRGVAASHRSTSRIVELSHPIRHGMVTYPGLPEARHHRPPVARSFPRPLRARHRVPHRADLDGREHGHLPRQPVPPLRRRRGPGRSPLDGLVDLDGLVIRTLGADAPAVDRNTLLPYDVTGRAVLIHTDWARHWGTDAYGAGGHPTSPPKPPPGSPTSAPPSSASTP
ncbi:hypothetical protein ACU686_33320 [Yinghuangia aomiensis]